MGDQGKAGWVPGSADQIRDSFNAAVVACLPEAYDAEAKDARRFAAWVALQCLHMDATPFPGGVANEAFFRGLSTPSVIAALMDERVNGTTLEAARAVLVQRFLEDDDTQARIIARARALAKDRLQEEQLERAEHGALFQRLAVAEVVEG